MHQYIAATLYLGKPSSNPDNGHRCRVLILLLQQRMPSGDQQQIHGQGELIQHDLETPVQVKVAHCCSQEA